MVLKNVRISSLREKSSVMHIDFQKERWYRYLPIHNTNMDVLMVSLTHHPLLYPRPSVAKVKDIVHIAPLDSNDEELNLRSSAGKTNHRTFIELEILTLPPSSEKSP